MSARSAKPLQDDLFGVQARVEAAPREPTEDRIAEQLPTAVRLGTSSWSFAGWVDLVYARSDVDASAPPPELLAKHGLAAYAQHPLLRAVSLDRTYYRPIEADAYAAYAQSVDDGFRFLVKAHADLTTPYKRDRDGELKPNPRLLDAHYANDWVVAPCVEGLGPRLGAILFQFSPLSGRILREPKRFATRLDGFLAALPRGPRYAVEIRNRELASPWYFDTLAAHNIIPCITIHPSMPPLELQMSASLASDPELPVVVRWNLNPDLSSYLGRNTGSDSSYERAKNHFAPFNEMRAPDENSRKALADLANDALAQSREVYVLINNKAEGCAPRSVRALAQAIAERIGA